MPRLARLVAVGLVLALGSATLSSTAAADDVSSAQRRAAGEFLAAAAAGDAQALAFALHPAELERIRSSVLQQLRDEQARGVTALRARLFGEAQPLADIERLTSINFFRALARRLQWQVRPYEEISGLVAVRDGNLVHVLVRGRQPRGLGKTEVVEVVSLLAYGKEWIAARYPARAAVVRHHRALHPARGRPRRAPSAIRRRCWRCSMQPSNPSWTGVAIRTIANISRPNCGVRSERGRWIR
jgi:hypothetical protein